MCARFKVEGFEVLWPGSRRVQGLGACFRFEVEGFEVWSAGNFLKLKGSKFLRVCSIQDRRVRGFVAWYTDPP